MTSTVLEANTISAAFPYQKKRRRVLGRDMVYVEVGKGALPAQTEVTVAGLHFLQEDSPNEIGEAIAH